jgi:hypothetical protein
MVMMLAQWSQRRIVCLAAALSLVLALFASPSLIANAGPPKSKAVIACFHKKVGRFTATAHPGRCEIRGHRGKRFERLPVKGMQWGHWGANPTRAAFGVDTRDGTRVRIVAYKPVICSEVRQWYSRIVVVLLTNGNGFELRLPTCVS